MKNTNQHQQNSLRENQNPRSRVCLSLNGENVGAIL